MGSTFDPFDGKFNTKSVSDALFAVDGSDATFCRLEFARAAVAGENLYIDGGIFTVFPDGKDGNQELVPNDQLLRISLTDAFSANNFTLETTRKDGIDNTAFGSMVALANGDVITIGGRNIDADITDSRWIFRGISMPKSGPLLRYTPSKSKWAGFLLSEAQSYGAAAVNIESEQLYFSNAAVEKTPNTVTPKPAVLEVDLKTYHSTNRASRSERQIVGGFSQFLPMGRKGVLVNFGGIDMGDKGKTQGMEKIEIYDVDTETWITQTAEGAKDSGVPSGRTDGCSVMAKAEDGSSWNIYMYGGLERDSGKALNDVWVLSIPSFTWIKLATNMASPTNAINPSCALSGRYLLTIAGASQTAPKAGGSCNPLFNTLDLTSLSWTETYFPNTKYEVAPPISSVIGGGLGGGATKNAPTKWTDSKIEEIFTGKVKFDPKATSRGGTSLDLQDIAVKDGSSPEAPKKGGISSKEWAGVISGVSIFAILVTAFVCFYIWRRKKRVLQQRMQILDSLEQKESRRSVEKIRPQTMITSTEISDYRSNISYSIDGRRYLARRHEPDTPLEPEPYYHPGVQVFFGPKKSRQARHSSRTKPPRSRTQRYLSGITNFTASSNGTYSSTNSASTLSRLQSEHPNLPPPHVRPPSMQSVIPEPNYPLPNKHHGSIVTPTSTVSALTYASSFSNIPGPTPLVPNYPAPYSGNTSQTSTYTPSAPYSNAPNSYYYQPLPSLPAQNTTSSSSGGIWDGTIGRGPAWGPLENTPLPAISERSESVGGRSVGSVDGGRWGSPTPGVNQLESIEEAEREREREREREASRKRFSGVSPMSYWRMGSSR